MTTEGKFIVLHGTNNLGKTTQAKLLVKRLNESGHQAEYTKYAHYDLEPSGKLINDYLRNGNPNKFTPREFQLLHFAERLQYEQTLKEKLEKGIYIIAEDYFPTAIAWGTAAGVDQNLLEYLYKGLRHENLAFLFDGNRFMDSIEQGHKHETDHELTNKVRLVYQDLGKKYGWIDINANDTIESIHKVIWETVQKVL
jgi:thymidylate kinase